MDQGQFITNDQLAKLISQAIADHENQRAIHHMRNETARDLVNEVVREIYQRVRISKTRQEFSPIPYPTDDMEPINYFTQTPDAFLGMKGMGNWYYNKTSDLLGKFSLNADCEKDLYWYPHMLCHLYDVFMNHDDIYSKFQIEFL